MKPFLVLILLALLTELFGCVADVTKYTPRGPMVSEVVSFVLSTDFTLDEQAEIVGAAIEWNQVGSRALLRISGWCSEKACQTEKSITPSSAQGGHEGETGIELNVENLKWAFGPNYLVALRGQALHEFGHVLLSGSDADHINENGDPMCYAVDCMMSGFSGHLTLDDKAAFCAVHTDVCIPWKTR
jgi:hypothetical protein